MMWMMHVCTFRRSWCPNASPLPLCAPPTHCPAALLPNNTTHLERLIAEGESRSQREKRRKIIEQYEAAAMAAATEQGSQLPSPDELRAQAEAAAATALERHNSNVIGLKHMSAEEVRRVVWWLAQSQGRPRTRPAPGKRVVSSQPSIQGMWTATTFGGM